MTQWMRSRWRRVVWMAMAATVILALGCFSDADPTALDSVPEDSGLFGDLGRGGKQPSGMEAVLVGAGDIATCSGSGDEATAALLDQIAGTVFTVGDNVYPSGTPSEYRNCYEPSWGRHRTRTMPSAGNHDYHTKGAAGYFAYFGSAAGDAARGYHSYDLDEWHIVVLNSNIARDAASAQLRWLRADLTAHAAQCTLAYWHHARFSGGSHGNDTSVKPFWDALYDAGADVVLAGHDHDYERFAPQTPSGAADGERGIRQFVVGTGGANLRGFETVRPNSEARNSKSHGLLKLMLGDGEYWWEFVPVAGGTFADAGHGGCH